MPATTAAYHPATRGHLDAADVDHLVDDHGWLRPLEGSSPSDVRAQHTLAHEAMDEAEADAYLEAQEEALVAAHGICGYIAYLLHYQAEAEAYEACLVNQFHDDPITRFAGLDEGEKRPTVRQLRARCAEAGCPLCGRTVGCYSCAREAGGDPFGPEDQLPQQRIVDEFTTNPADPTTAYVLACGHTII